MSNEKSQAAGEPFVGQEVQLTIHEITIAAKSMNSAFVARELLGAYKKGELQAAAYCAAKAAEEAMTEVFAAHGLDFNDAWQWKLDNETGVMRCTGLGDDGGGNSE